ncbi:MAG: TetR/AcrR family transcriptional regulator [Solirubrobacterales bacterium]|nr:TetR/AcrR family transcriptional regulator [Solirubrobacterales bacterium]
MVDQPSPRPRRDHGARPSKQQLLRGARQAFAALGYHGATMQRIADHAGCTKPTLYAHFADKEAIYRETVESEIEALQTRLFETYAVARELPLYDQISASMLVFFEYAAAEPDGFRLLFGDNGGGPLEHARAEMVGQIRLRIAELSRSYAAGLGLKLGPSADVLAAMMVSVAIDGAHQSILVTPVDPIAAGQLATHFTAAALRHLDPAYLNRIDRTAEG